MIGNSGPTAARAAATTSAGNRVRASERAAVTVSALVRFRPEELVEQVAVGTMELDGVESRVTGVDGGSGVGIGDQAQFAGAQGSADWVARARPGPMG